ncbi:MAG: tRNA pseudouridine(38-40) synthase TruA [Bdellovibrionales bacterium]|nr:tRNA pseudouridine(38-40) synthase TruA [Bdellovibrionales bacterium]
MRNICIYIAYDGTNYVGWQKQPNHETVQELVENALSIVANESVVLLGSGRTDAGVHARKQVANFFLQTSTTPTEAFIRGTNSLLPQDIRVFEAKEVDQDFHVIRHVKSKVYRYFFSYQKVPDVFQARYTWHVFTPFDVTLMEQASKALLGEHDFACFATHGVVTKSTVRTIFEVTFGKTEAGVDYVEFSGSGFLRHMIRSIMGTLMEIGTGKKNPDVFQKILQSQDRSQAGETAPAQGLFLWDVRYEDL